MFNVRLNFYNQNQELIMYSANYLTDIGKKSWMSQLPLGNVHRIVQHFTH